MYLQICTGTGPWPCLQRTSKWTYLSMRSSSCYLHLWTFWKHGSSTNRKVHTYYRAIKEQWSLPVNCLTQRYYTLMKIFFYEQHARASCICLLEGINHAKRRTNKPLSIGDKEMLYQSWPVHDVLAWHTYTWTRLCLSKEHLIGLWWCNMMVLACLYILM